ncbi:hypothetical protein H696_03405 [Fonticula alba]|uniref:Oxysterol-binding protein n=1 Tax=Fonticula alba TaxID=691883 RepID=A0A058Z6Q7_FONAL|nr:hypothetical protein H696_03405 [Fonticula alba]KCV69940.1 hypothetical protein H696_03405 [Fonticula alba]|eukprot:XP_009495546.1 hypothetical protein H696_03405 [Fonticula alba]
MSEDNVVPTSQKGSFTTFLKTIASTTADLSTLSCPAFLLEGISVLEHTTSYMMVPELLFNINKESDPVARMRAVVAWWITNVYQSYGAPFAGGSSVKKPYNPVLGEQFHCTWPKGGPVESEVHLEAEQVSHHPPVSAFYLECPEQRLCVNGSIFSGARFRGTSVRVRIYGHVVLRLQDHDDEYRLTYPEADLRGLFTGQLFAELSGMATITSKSGYSATINYLPKPWFHGSYHMINGFVSPSSSHNVDNALFHISGKWVGRVMWNEAGSKTQNLLLDVDTLVNTNPTVPPLEEQGELESQKIWAPVTAALRVQDYSTALAEKNTIEEHQRALRRQREADGTPFQAVHFDNITDMSQLIPENDICEETGTVISYYWQHKRMLQ